MLNKVEREEFLSEISHYQVTKLAGNMNTVHLKNFQTNEEVGIGYSYIQQYCKSASQFDETIKVGKEDKYWTEKQVLDWIKFEAKLTNDPIERHSGEWLNLLSTAPRVGDLKLEGIRTIFQNIRDQTAFTAWFYKVDTKKTKKAYKEEIEARVQSFLEPILKAKAQKKSMEEAVRASVMNLIENPVLDYIPGELRKMICYKVDFTSRDGNYKVFDLEKQSIGTVNIKTLQSIVINGKKYEVE